MNDSKPQGESNAAPGHKDERDELSEEELVKVAGGRGVIASPGASKGIWVQQGENTPLGSPEIIVVPAVKP